MAPTANFNAWAEKYNTRKVVLMEVTAIKPSNGSTVALYFCDTPWRNGVFDGSHYYEPAIKTPPTVTHRIQNVTHGVSLVAYGSIQLAIERGRTIDPAGSLTWDELLSDYTFRGQPVTVRVGSPDLEYSDFATVLAGYIDLPNFTDFTLDLIIKGSSEVVATTQVPPNVYGHDQWDAWTASTGYGLGDFASATSGDDAFFECTSAGTSGASEPTWPVTDTSTVADGGVTWTCRVLPDSTIGNVRPITYGWCNNISPVLLNEAAHMYQVHDPSYGPIEDVTAVYVDGVEQTISTDYTLSADNCTVTMTTNPQGLLTCDVKGRQVSGSFIDQPGDILNDMLTTLGEVDSGDLDSASFTTFSAALSYPVGINIASTVELQAAADSMLTGLLSFWGTNRAGDWFVRRFTPAIGSADLELTEDPDIIENSFGSEPEARLYHEAVIAGDRNHTIQNTVDSSVDEERRVWLAEDFRERVSSDDSVLTIYPVASIKGGPHQTHLKNLDDCETMAGLWMDLFGQARQVVSFSTKLRALQVGLGDEIKITRDQFGYASGAYGRLVGVTENYGAGTMKLEVWI